MQALVLTGVVLVAAVMWVGVIMTMLTGLDRAERRAGRRAGGLAERTDAERDRWTDTEEAPPKGRS